MPVQSLHSLKWDLGLPNDFDRNLVKKYPEKFRVVKGRNGLDCLKLVQWQEEFSVSKLHKINEWSIHGAQIMLVVLVLLVRGI